MHHGDLIKVQKELAAFVELFRGELGRSERRQWCGAYLSGLLLDGERKSIQPIAERIEGGNVQAISQFVNQSPWAYEPVQHKLRERLIVKFGGPEGVLILDDTTFPKKGSRSVGVSHQYCGALGKQSNCQCMVTWQYANGRHHFPLRAELYLPESWTSDKGRMKRAGVPKERFELVEKWRLGLKLLDEIRLDVPHQVLLADAGYGQSKEFLHELDERGEKFIVQIPSSMSFWSADVPVAKKPKKDVGRPPEYEVARRKKDSPQKASEWIRSVEENDLWQTIVLPHKTKKKLTFAALRVREVRNSYYRRPGKERWLLIEKRGDEHKYFLASHDGAANPGELMKLAHQRWKVEQGYQQLKEELGLDHFEGRSWLGFNHHVTLCFMAYAFLLLRGARSKKNPDDPYGQKTPQQTGAT